MKKFTRVLVAFMAATMLLLTLPFAASAKVSVTDMQESVIFISTTVNFSASNYNLGFYMSFSGTGFAVGVPGEKVQYVATNHHVVGEESGIYTLYLDEYDNILDFQQEAEGTAYPSVESGVIDGVEIYAVTDYFKATTTEMTAHFSANDYTTLTLVDSEPGVDLALCKLACEPTDKIKAFPLQLKGNCEKGDRIICFGYPGISEYGNAEMRLDPSDCTIQDGMISKIERTYGRFGSEKTFDALLVTADIFHGMSGGPVFNEDTGAIVGVNCFGFVVDGEDARYAICIDYLLDMLDKEHIKYTIYSGNNAMLYIIIGAAALVVVIAIVIILVVRSNKKKRFVTPAAPYTVAAPVSPAVAPASNGKYYLFGLSGPLAGRKFSFESTVTIGRDGSRCNVTFPVEQPGVSSLHCEVKVNGGNIYLTDLGSSYGTFLGDGTKLDAHTPVILTSGSKFWVGAKENLFEVKY